MAKVKYAGPAVEQTAGENLGGNRVIVVLGDLAFYADKDNLSHVDKVRGISTEAFTTGNIGCVQIGGFMQDPSWSWTPDLPVFLSNNGLLTQTVPTTGFILQLGVADTATRILIDLKMPIVQ